MKTLVLAVVLLLPTAASAQSPFDGTWKVDVESAKFPEKPDQIVLADGRYSCSTCVPAREVKADGTDQKVSGSPYFDTLAVRVVDERSAQLTYKQAGQVTQEGTSTVSADGTEVVDKIVSYPPEGKPVEFTARRERVAKGPAGSHALSGSWRMKKVDQVSESALTFTYKSTPDGLSMTTPTGESYDAKFDGKDYPIKGDRGGSTVSLARVDDRTIEETTKREGKVVGVSRVTVAPDGSTLTMIYEDKQRGTKTSVTAKKQ
jgi:hypothetical protein